MPRSDESVPTFKCQTWISALGDDEIKSSPNLGSQVHSRPRHEDTRPCDRLWLQSVRTPGQPAPLADKKINPAENYGAGVYQPGPG
jgi:hypothetical protein